jgi:hypothetical protein
VMTNSQIAVWPDKDQSSVEIDSVFHGPSMAHAWPKSLFRNAGFDYWSHGPHT